MAICRRTFIVDKRRESVGDSTEPCGTPLLIGTEGEVDASANTKIERIERMLCWI